MEWQQQLVLIQEPQPALAFPAGKQVPQVLQQLPQLFEHGF
jgi:hypothetical protein